MKNKKIKIAYLLTTFIFLFTYIGGLLDKILYYDDINIKFSTTAQVQKFCKSGQSQRKYFPQKQKQKS